MSCPVAAMAPGTNVGAATPVGLSGGDLADEGARTTRRPRSASSPRRTAATRTSPSPSCPTPTSITAEEALDDERDRPHRADDRGVCSRSSTGTTVTLGDGATDHAAHRGRDDRRCPLGAHGVPARPARPEPRVHLLLARARALIVLELIVPGHIFAGTIGTLLLIIALVSFGVLPVRFIGIALLVLSVFLRPRAERAGLRDLGRDRRRSPCCSAAGSSTTEPEACTCRPACWSPSRSSSRLFFGLSWSKALAIRHVPPAQTRTIVGTEGVRPRPVSAPTVLVRVRPRSGRRSRRAVAPRRKPGPRHRPRRARAHRRADHR